MEQETLFTASKWDILTALAEHSRSPVELANNLNTSVANISQQLRLLEMAGLVKSKRISNRDKGLPRVQYSLAGNQSYLIATAQEFVGKKFLKLTERNKVVMRIWFLDNPELHYYLEKAFWNIDEHLNNIDSIFFDKHSGETTLVILSDDKNLKKEIKDLNLKNPDGAKRTIKFNILDSKSFGKTNPSKDRFYPLYDTLNFFNDNSDNKGDDK